MDPTDPEVDRRRHPRIQARLPLDITFLDNETGSPIAPAHNAAMINVSAGGLCARVVLPQVENAALVTGP